MEAGLDMNTYRGSCHCQSIIFELRCVLEFAYLCDCSLCSRRGAKMVYTNKDDFKLIEGKENLSCYQFNTQVAEHYFCKICGIYTFHKPRTLLDKMGVNAGCLEGIDSDDLSLKLVNGAAR